MISNYKFYKNNFEGGFVNYLVIFINLVKQVQVHVHIQFPFKEVQYAKFTIMFIAEEK